MEKLIKSKKSVIVSMDMSTTDKQDKQDFADLVRLTGKTPGVGGYKISSALAVKHGLPHLVGFVRDLMDDDKVLIYDHQKAGNDTPHTAKAFMRTMKFAGVDAVILFPFTGPVAQRAWMDAGNDIGVRMIGGGEMTHPQFRYEDGGNILRREDIYKNFVRAGVEDFVLPGNSPDKIREVRGWIEKYGCSNPALYSPGLISQGGDITESGEAAGDTWHVIVGRRIIDAEDPCEAVREVVATLNA